MTDQVKVTADNIEALRMKLLELPKSHDLGVESYEQFTIHWHAMAIMRTILHAPERVVGLLDTILPEVLHHIECMARETIEQHERMVPDYVELWLKARWVDAHGGQPESNGKVAHEG